MISKDHLLDDIARRLVRPSPEPPPDDAHLLKRIEEISKNARVTWFGLLGLLVFVGVTLMGVTHLDFYGVARQTKLPIVGVSVPTLLFFWTAPVLTAAVYSYFHLYLMKLWDALGRARPTQGEDPLSEAIYPWLVADAALILRHWRRGDGSAPPRALALISTFLSILLAWAFGLVVLGVAWWWSMPARDPWMTLWIALSGLFAGWVGLTSLVVVWRRMGGNFAEGSHRVWNAPRWSAAACVIVLAVGWASIDRTRGVGEFLLGPSGEDGVERFSLLPLAPINLADSEIAVKPAGWLNRDTAEKDFRAVWCRRENVDCAKLTELETNVFSAEWNERRADAIASIPRPDLSGRDLRMARLRDAFLVGVDPGGARLEGADLWKARIEGADLREALMEKAYLGAARMEGANLFKARMEGADLSGARMEGADLSGARMEGATLFETRMEGADLSGAWMEGALLWETGLKSTDLRAESMRGSALRIVDLTEVSQIGPELLMTAFGDGSVIIPDGAPRPTDWPAEVIESDVTFFGRWRWWRESEGLPWPPPGKVLDGLVGYEPVAPDPAE